MQREAHIRMILIQRMPSHMLHNGCKIITMGIKRKVRIFLKNVWLEEIFLCLTTRKNRSKSLYRKKSKMSKSPKNTRYVFGHMYKNVCVMSTETEVRLEN